MRKHEQIEILVNHLDDNTKLFTSYLKTVLENKNKRFWDDSEAVKVFTISYFQDLEICCSLKDEDLDECDENEEISFFNELYAKKNKVDEEEGFLPKQLRNIELDMELYDRFEEWIYYCWKVACPSNFHLPAFLDNYDAASYYKNLRNGEKGDHLWLMDQINPEEK